MARNDDELQPTAQPSSLPPTERAHPGYEVVAPNLSRVSAATFRRGSISRHRVNIAVGILLVIAAAVLTLVLFADVLFANLGSILMWLFIVAAAVGIVGLALIKRDEQRARRASVSFERND
ncbi:NADH:ubiquinone oxidoreductase subunit K [Mycetocola sp. CAN_C7]|uniref:hypothetical protein n=1 Tax=Mycetocola sp. CAN_C7 TaxID=2787724 RepID=UPI0018CAA390